jgi:glycosyltransferase involved in cell wall biosynthesis
MKICLIIDDYMPYSIKVGAKMMHELACELKEQGHEITVITPSSTLRVKKEITTLDNITIYQFRSGEIKNTGKVKRAINESLLSYYAKNYLREELKANPHDLIVYYSPTIFWGGLVKYLKRLWKAPSYLILRDFFPQWASDQGLIKKGSLIEKYFSYHEKKNYASANTIGIMSQKNLEWFNSNYRVKSSVEVLYNWAKNDSINSNNFYRKKLHLEDKVVYFYGGNMGHAQDMMNLVRLAIKMKKVKSAHFVFVGAGDEVKLIKNSIKKEKLKNITLLPSVSQKEFQLMLSEFDVGLFTLHREHTTHNFPGKILGYMVQQLPILGSVNKDNDIKEVLENANAGLISINGEDKLFLENALELLNEKKRKDIGKNAYQLLHSHFSVKAISKQILQSKNISIEKNREK